MLATAEPYRKPPTKGSVAKPMPEKLQQELLNLFLSKAKEANCSEFDELCQTMRILTQQGVKDSNALEIVRKRFINKGGHCSASDGI